MPILATPNGPLSYVRAGRRGGPTLLLVQGVGVPGCGWRPQVEELADRFDLVTFDNRGIGDSPRGSAPISVESMAADALAIADAEELDRFHLVGHSLGGLIAQQVTLAAPGRVKTLALLCTFLRGKQGARLTPGILLAGLRCQVGTRAMRRAAFLELVMPRAYLARVEQPALAESLRLVFGRDLADQPPIAMAQLRAMARFDASARLGAITAPTLVVTATHDRIAPPEHGRALAAAISGARYVELGDAAHGAPIQKAAEVNGLLAAHATAAE